MRAIGSACALACAFAASAAAQPTSVEVRTRVIDAAGRPVRGARIVVEGADATATADARGEFRIRVTPGAMLVIEAPGFDAGIAIASEAMPAIVLRTGERAETIEVRGEAPLASATPPAALVTRDEIRTLPGARGDAIEAIRNLPGVAFASSGQGSPGDLAIRGTSGSDSWYLLDGVGVPNVMHLGGVTAVLSVELIGSIQLHPGGFDVAYGRATGGIVELTTRPARSDTWRAAGELSFVHASAYAEGPVWRDRVTLIAGVRRSFLDLVLPAVIPDDAGLSFTQFPVYTDAQLRLDWHATRSHQLTVLGLYSDDGFATTLEQEIANDPAFSGFAVTDRFWRLAATWRYDGRHTGVRTVVSAGTDRESLDFGDLHYLDVSSVALTGRSDVRIELADRVALRGGVDAQATISDLAGRLPLGGGEGSPDPNLTLDPAFELAAELRDEIVAGYVAADLRPIAELAITPGVRLERFGFIDDVVVQPRIAAALELGGVTTRASLGRFARPHDQAETIVPHLDAETAIQSAFGVEKQLGDDVRASATIFASWLDHLSVFDPALATMEDQRTGYSSRGTGRARGLELMAQVRRDELFGWIAYTFSQSRRIDGPGLSERVFDQDQPHNLVAAGSWRLGRWRFGARFRLASGTPNTPIVGAVYVADHDVYRPMHGAPNSERLPATHQVDLRIDRSFRLGGVKLSAYLDVTNVYANPRVSGFAYDFDYRNREPITELPFLPSLGLRGEL